ncbi:PEGA domain-containing protein [Candidatus Gottesmanbacteria bacterium]|nr:PEGA domain-containing protein [Candidatus Gottesmanbacteria bacterium]
MTWQKTRPVLISILTVCLILGVSIGIIAYGRGYRVNLNRPTQLKPTGLVSATSDPVGAQVFLDNQLKTATNNSFNVEPGWYTVRIIKEGFIGWEKKLRVQGEVVTRADAYLFPTSPSLSPITTSGVLSATLSPDGGKIAFLVPSDAIKDGIKKPGLYVLELADRPLGRNRDPKFIADLPADLKEAPLLLWSPDATQIIIFGSNDSTLYTLTDNTREVLTQTRLTAILGDWRAEVAEKDLQKLVAFRQPFIDVATSSARILSFSPDETKLLYEATAAATIVRVIEPPFLGANPTEEVRTIKPGNMYVYDSREDKNFFLLEKKEIQITNDQIPKKPSPKNQAIGNSSPNRLVWFPTNKHLLLTGNSKIDIMEYDRTNWITLYSGPFEGSFVTPWPTGSRIVILTNLNPTGSTLPNLYTVNLR